MTTTHSAMVRRRGRAVLRLLAAGGLAATLAGCYPPQVVRDEYPTDYRQRHPIVLREGVQSVEVMLGRNRGGLTPSQRADVLAFAQTWRQEAGSGIIMDVPRGGRADRSAADSIREIRSIFSAFGVPPNAVYVRRYRPAPSSIASIKLNYSKLIAEAGPCGQWPGNIGPSLDPSYIENREYWNFGCATQRNLAAMVDNPADLVQPRGETAAYAQRRSVALDKYRKGENPSANYTGYQTGKIGEVGK